MLFSTSLCKRKFLLLHSSILKVPLSPEMSVPIYQTSEENNIHSHHHETQTPLKLVASFKVVAFGFV